MFKSKIIALKDGLLDFKVYAEEDGKETYFKVFSASIDKSITEPEITHIFRTFSGTEFMFVINEQIHFVNVAYTTEEAAYFESFNRKVIIEPLIDMLQKYIDSNDEDYLDIGLHYIVNTKQETGIKPTVVSYEKFIDATTGKVSIIHVWLKDQAELVFKVDNGKVSLDKIFA